MDKVYVVLVKESEEGGSFVAVFKTLEQAQDCIEEALKAHMDEENTDVWFDENGDEWPLDTFPMFIEEHTLT